MLIGLVNGLFVTRLKIPSFLVTLGMLLVVRGIALYITDGFPQRTWSAEGSWLAELLVGDFYVGDFRVYMSLFWFILARRHPRLRPDAGPGSATGSRPRAATRAPPARAACRSAAPRSRCSC